MGKKARDVIRPTDAEAVRLARTLLRTARYGALATLDPGDGAPVATRVAVATDLDGTPVILVSALSTHTGALEADRRCSLLLGEPGRGDPLAHPRISIACTGQRLAAEAAETARVRRRYLNRHPKAALYADFADFCFFRLEPRGASLNGGFGRAYRLRRDELVTLDRVTAALAEAEQAALEHMNTDHADAVEVYAHAFAGAHGGGWKLIGIDAEGLDLANGDQVRRVLFPTPLGHAAALRQTLVEMATDGRQKLTGRKLLPDGQG